MPMPEEQPRIIVTPDLDEELKGLLHYKKWWFMREVGISVNGQMLTGTPILMHERTLRVVNDDYSYFIPMRNIDYIRTPDGLSMLLTEFTDPPLPCEPPKEEEPRREEEPNT